MMAGIRGKDTQPELAIRSGLHRMGFRFRTHRKDLPGKPDLVFPKYRAVIFVQGCFWHGHDCHMFKWPKTREDFWRQKIGENRQRDQLSVAKLLEGRWRVGQVWECALKGRAKLDRVDVLQSCAAWLTSSADRLEIGSCEARPPLRVF